MRHLWKTMGLLLLAALLLGGCGRREQEQPAEAPAAEAADVEEPPAPEPAPEPEPEPEPDPKETAVETLLAEMSRRVQPWNVSLPAQAAGTAALEDSGFLEASRRLIQAERPRLAAGLEELGFTVCPSQANYLLLKSPIPLHGPLLERGILIRDCANYRGLGPGWYRTAVKRPEENRLLLAALAEIAGGIRNT